MELHSQIKKYRASMNLSQEELAEKIFVSRQSISNWENDKTYPDIHSLLLLSNLFGISLDQLIKGDIEVMREEIKEADVKEYNLQANILATLTIVSVISFVPLIKFLGVTGIVLWVFIYAITMIYAFKVQKFNNKHNIHTYKEIVAFLEGKSLDEIEKIQEKVKRPYQTAVKFLAGAAVGLVLGVLLIIVLK